MPTLLFAAAVCPRNPGKAVWALEVQGEKNIVVVTRAVCPPGRCVRIVMLTCLTFFVSSDVCEMFLITMQDDSIYFM